MPITYSTEMGWQTELLRLMPTIALLGLYIWFTRRQLGGGGFGGGGGMGSRGIFNVGKAQVWSSHLSSCHPDYLHLLDVPRSILLYHLHLLDVPCCILLYYKK